jgi:hypothetical protein
MTKILKIIILFICLHLTESWENSLNQLKDEFNYRLNTSIKIHDVYEKRMEEMMKLFTGI